MSLPPHPCHVPDGWVITCFLIAITWLQPQVAIRSFLHIALNMLDNPETQIEIAKPHLGIEERFRHLPLLISGGFVLCTTALRNALLYYMEDVNKFPLLLFRAALSTQATLVAFNCISQNAPWSVREEEPCSKVKPLASFLLCSSSILWKNKTKNMLPEGEFFIWSRKCFHPCQLTYYITLEQRDVNFARLLHLNLFSNYIDPAMGDLFPYVLI